MGKNALSCLWESCMTCFAILLNCMGACVWSNLLSSCFSAGEEIPQWISCSRPLRRQVHSHVCREKEGKKKKNVDFSKVCVRAAICVSQLFGHGAERWGFTAFGAAIRSSVLSQDFSICTHLHTYSEKKVNPYHFYNYNYKTIFLFFLCTVN